MISYLKGQLVDKHPPTLILENGNIGYTIEASMQTFYQLNELNVEVLLHIHLLIRDERPVLYGFLKQEERQLFQELLKVNTIGPKAALAILSTMDAHTLYQAVTHQNVRALQSIPSIGRKTAERLLLELTNRLDYWKPNTIIEKSSEVSESATLQEHQTTQQDAISALIALGYKPQVAAQAIYQQTNSDLSTEQLIRVALTQLVK